MSSADLGYTLGPSILPDTLYGGNAGTVRDLHVTLNASTVETACTSSSASLRVAPFLFWVANTSATATVVTFRDLAAGLVRLVVPVPANDVRGFSVAPRSPLPPSESGAGRAWTAQSSASVTSVEITVVWVWWP